MINRTVEYKATHATSKGTYEISRCAIRVIDEDSKVARDWILRASLARQGLIEGEAPANVMVSCERIPSSLNLRQLKDIEEDILEQFDLDKSVIQSVVKEIRKVLLVQDNSRTIHSEWDKNTDDCSDVLSRPIRA